MPLRPCLGVHGQPCNRLTRGSRCPEHQAEADRRREASRPSWVQRYGKDWQRVAKQFVDAAVRRGEGCVYCHQVGHYDEAGVHNSMTAGHIVAREDGGTNDDENLQLECRHCNSRKKRSRKGT
ncbi:HNH endonuclease [Nocardiopsis gilva YIM 90087]|uniref:HNH endonuclease n=1 Tax=Nocardiopsis gilva YIM 90087 TaxID=1235441 RepID=A0A223S618_9ACTN|nr:HNH endonuclease signature motif containing protein [Nocardiopsis gilva]ASU83570.1 HNH endonuclease [Nocardiopsis gilva YIM 90087]